MALTPAQRRFLRGLAHDRKALVLVGQAGVTGGLSRELDETLAHHELVKVKVRAGDRAARDQIIESLCRDLGAELVQRVGNVVTLFRADTGNPRIRLPGR